MNGAERQRFTYPVLAPRRPVHPIGEGMWYANEADAQADQNLHAWFDLARDEVEGIRLCRDKPETNDWTNAAPRRGPIPLRCMPEKHTAAITTVAGWMLHHHPTLDTSPLHDLAEIITTWWTDRNANRLPSQARIDAVFARCSLLAGAAFEAIISRSTRTATSSEATGQPPPDPFAEPRRIAKDMSATRRTIVESVCDRGGAMPLIELAELMEWSDAGKNFQSHKEEIAKHFKNTGWKLFRLSNLVRLEIG